MGAAAEKLLRLQKDAEVLIALYDPGDRLRYANRAFRKAFHLDDHETPLWSDLMRRNHRARRGTVIEHDDFEAWLSSTVSRRGKTASRGIESGLYDGRWIWIVETVQPDGWMMCVGSDVTELRRSERSLRQDRDLALKASVTDELTGVSNRRHVLSHLDRIVAGASETKRAGPCLCLLDLDGFKAINDRLGHPSGDKVLVAFARLVRSVVRLKDCFGRVGGEEFLLILPDTRLEDARRVLDRIMDEVRGSRPLQDAPEFGYACSGGLVVWQPGDSAQLLYARADEALYRAKHEGRDRIVER